MTAQQQQRVAESEYLGGYGWEFRGGFGFAGHNYRDRAGVFFCVSVKRNERTGETTTRVTDFPNSNT